MVDAPFTWPLDVGVLLSDAVRDIKVTFKGSHVCAQHYLSPLLTVGADITGLKFLRNCSKTRLVITHPLRNLTTLKNLVFEGCFIVSNLMPLFGRPSCLDTLSTLRLEKLHKLPKGGSMVNELSNYIERAAFLKHFAFGFNNRGASAERLIEAVAKSPSIEYLQVDLKESSEPEISMMLALIKETKQINVLKVTASLGDYRVLEAVSRNESVVTFSYTDHWDQEAFELDYNMIVGVLPMNKTLNKVHLDYQSVNDHERTVDEILDAIHDDFPNYDEFTLNTFSYNRFEILNNIKQDLAPLIKVARVFAGSRMTKSSRLPPELFRLIITQGFEHEKWYDYQLEVVATALLDRRTLGLVYGDILRISEPYLYVRCREALVKVRQSS